MTQETRQKRLGQTLSRIAKQKSRAGLPKGNRIHDQWWLRIQTAGARGEKINEKVGHGLRPVTRQGPGPGLQKKTPGTAHKTPRAGKIRSRGRDTVAKRKKSPGRPLPL